mmetsp:Transcript_23980/g.38631  ORF Transcript_23980/g.38631 Transcript_23980/m.38631 type:complete len:187 (-) Transcript_23980:69-629(-)
MWVPRSYIYGCHKNKGQRVGWKCAKASDKLGLFYNGITATKDRSFVFAADMYGNLIRMFKITADGLLEARGEIASPHMIDNLDYDESSGSILASATPFPFLSAKIIMGDDTVVNPGGLTVFSPDPASSSSSSVTPPKLEATFDLLQDGQALSMISTGIIWGDSVVLGSPFKPGVAVCTTDTSEPSL